MVTMAGGEARGVLYTLVSSKCLLGSFRGKALCPWKHYFIAGGQQQTSRSQQRPAAPEHGRGERGSPAASLSRGSSTTLLAIYPSLFPHGPASL